MVKHMKMRKQLNDMWNWLGSNGYLGMSKGAESVGGEDVWYKLPRCV